MRFAFMCKEKGLDVRARIAIVGAGPAGLAAAGYLACAGAEVDVYDKLPMPGGMMMFVIPPYRIPRESVLEGIEDLEKRLGVKFVTKTKVFEGEVRHDEGDEFVERTIPLSKLVEEYDAVLIATGTWRSRRMGIENEDAKGVYTALEFIYWWYLYDAKLLNRKPEMGRKVVVIGGGLSAVDAAETALRKGAEEVHLLYRRTIREAPAGAFEIKRLVREGVNWMELVQPKRIIVENGVVTGIEMVRMRLGPPDESGRPRPIPIEGSEFVIEADTVIAAVGELPTPPLQGEALGIKLDRRGRIQVDRFWRAAPKIYAAGDVVSGPSMVGKAVGSGLRAAKAVATMLRGVRI